MTVPIYNMRFILATAAVVLMSTSAFAQVPPAASKTTIADPSRTDERLRQNEMMPSVAPDITVKKPDTQSAPAGAEKIKFTLKQVSTEGVTVYSDASIASVYNKSVGQTITLAEAYGIANAITAKYRNDGYILTQVVVPPQTIEDGTLRLRVVEGTLDEVRVQGPDGEGAAMNLIRDYAGQIKTNGGPLNVKDLERFLLLINDLPGVSARSILSPSPDKVGAADLTVITTRDPFDAVVGIDNYGSRYLGQWETIAAASVNSFFDLNERITGQIAYAPGSNGIKHPELAYGALSYWMPVGNKGTNVEGTYSFTDTEPGYDLEQFDVTGRSHYGAVKVSHPFIRSREKNLVGRVLFDARNVKTENILEPDRTDQIRAVRVGARYEFIDTLLGAGLNTVDIEFAKGLNILGASGKNDPNKTRPLGDPQFMKVEAEAQRLQRISDVLNVVVGFKGQWSNDAQLASEEFGLGGATGYGRGYDPSEITGDDGIAGKVELQWQNPVKLNWWVDHQAFGFWDVGKVWNDDNTTNSSVESLASAGAGLRFDLPEAMELETFVAVPLTRDVQVENNVSPRFYLSFRKQF